jgi:2-desacetyl-2-hydroxyethyl bacteriochlorophyllide A dehydrogenase
MRAIVCTQPGSLVIEERPEPERGAGEVLIQICRIGICGTDYHIYEGAHPYLEYPRVMGHELSAEVLETPPSSLLNLGQRVVVNPYMSCGVCIACRNGKPNCCLRISVLGVHRDGGMCERISVPEGNLYPADDLSIDQAASIEFLAIGAHSVGRSGLGKGTRTLVVGAGPIGLGVAIFAGLAGAVVTVMDRDLERLSFAGTVVDSARAIVADDNAPEAVAEATEGDGFEVVIDATGNPASMELTFGFVAHGGALVLVSVVRESISFSDPEFHKREMALLGSRNALRSDFENVMTAIRDGRVPLNRLITHRTTLARAVTEIPRWTKEKRGLVKALIEVV